VGHRPAGAIAAGSAAFVRTAPSASTRAAFLRAAATDFVHTAPHGASAGSRRATGSAADIPAAEAGDIAVVRARA
jgi:hypothetical protein